MAAPIKSPLAQDPAPPGVAPHPAAAAAAQPKQLTHQIPRRDLLRIALVLAAAAAVGLKLWEPWRQVSVIGLGAALAGGYPIYKHALRNIAERRMTMELSMTIALAAALAIGEFFTALLIIVFVLAAEVLEKLTVDRGRQTIGNLLDYLPRTASVYRGQRIEEMPTQAIQPGDRVLIRPGSRIPVDGEVVDGHSWVEEAAITGEPMPAEKSAGSQVYAGSLNQVGTLEVRSERLGKETTFGRIVEAVERAEQSRAPIQKTADRLAGYLVYFALAAAALTYAATRNPQTTISVVIVAGACGIAAGTPLAILGAIGRAAQRGAIIKGGIYLEMLWQLDTVFFDKTGTLTFGHPRVAALWTATGITPQQLLEAAACVELSSEHPLGRAIVRRAEEDHAVIEKPEKFQYRVGQGVLAECRGETILAGSRRLLAEHGLAMPANQGAETGTEVWVARGGRLYGCIRIQDALRPSAYGAVRALKAQRIQTVLLTGDNRRVAEATARELGIASVHAELLPHQKTAFVAELARAGKTVAMLGDGINDAPALSEASVGVAMGAGTDVARESADVVLIGDDLGKFVETLAIAGACHGIIQQNFYGTLLVDGIGLALASLGMLNPLLAAFIHVASEITFILNSSRMLPKAPSVRLAPMRPLAG